ncbi:MAG: cysteine synthase family protein [Bdellovibrionota bacterium]
MKTHSKISNSVEDLVGQTPLIRLNASLRDVPAGLWLKKEKGIENHGSLHGEILTKVEFFNPGGSVKDRIAIHILNKAEERGEIKPGATVVEATSGNTGAGLAMIAARRGYKAILVMPDKMSAEKINALRAYGAKVVITPTAVLPEDPKSNYRVAERLAKEIPNAFLANQYQNPDNPEAHYLSTGPEIWEQCDGKLDYFFCGLGTGGTASGTAKFLKEKNPKIKLIGIDPVGSLYYENIKTGKGTGAKTYLTEGIGEDFIPGTIDLKLVDDAVYVSDAESFSAARMLAQKEGLLVGGSCGSAFYGAAQYLRYLEEKESIKDYRAVVLIPDSGSRYLSKVFNDPWLAEKNVSTQWNDLTLGGDVEYVDGSKKIAGV